VSYHALVIDDCPEVRDDVADRLEALGHTCDTIASLTEAREQLAEDAYSYVLLDLEIPVRYGRPSRIPNGRNLIQEIRQTPGHESTPIIVMTSHGHDGPDLAVEVMRGHQAIDYVKKPFAEDGRTLETAVKDALHVTGRSRPGAARRSGPDRKEPPQPFEHGEMVFFDDRVELCDVVICDGPGAGLIWDILDELKEKTVHGRYVAYSGNRLAKRLGCEAGENGISGAVRDFRTKLERRLRDEANISCEPRELLASGGPGYRFTDKITVRVADEPENEPVNEPDDPVNEPNKPDADPALLDLNERQHWALAQVQNAGSLQLHELMRVQKCSRATAKRDLAELRRRGLIEFVGPARTGAYHPSACETK
jgi:CheY-like chemotaxis protein